MFSWWGRYLYFNNENIQTRDFVIMNAAYVSSGSFGSRVGQNLLEITYIKTEELIYIKNQHQYMDQFINLILIFHTQ